MSYTKDKNKGAQELNQDESACGEKTACPLPPPIPTPSPEHAKDQKARGDAAEGKDDPNTENDGDNGPGSD
jgi:hypothetical protein